MNLYICLCYYIKYEKIQGFTIVELLVVIVIIGILATITVVSYRGIQQKAIIASLKSDLSNASTKLKLFEISNGIYPTTINCEIPDSSTNLCLSPSPSNSFIYNVDNSRDKKYFGLSVVAQNDTSYRITKILPQ